MRKKQILLLLVILLICIVTPLLVEYWIPIPSGNGDWLSFWGSYLGIIPSGLIAYFVAKYQIDREHEKAKKEKDRDCLPYFNVDMEKRKINFNSINSSLPIQQVILISYYSSGSEFKSEEEEERDNEKIIQELNRELEADLSYSKIQIGQDEDDIEFINESGEVVSSFGVVEISEGILLKNSKSTEEALENVNSVGKHSELAINQNSKINFGSMLPGVDIDIPEKERYNRVDVVCTLVNEGKIFYTSGLYVENSHFVKWKNEPWEQYVFERKVEDNQIARNRLKKSDIY